MTDYTKLIHALRECGERAICNDCPIFDTCDGDIDRAMHDAAAAIEALQTDNAEMIYELEDAAKQIRELQDEVLSYASGSQPHWVSVEDELPDTPRMVIAYVDQWHIFAAYHSSGGAWKQADGFTVVGVTHWMPIEPPKEGED